MAKKYVIGQKMQSTKRKDEAAWGVESSGGTACYLEGDQGRHLSRELHGVREPSRDAAQYRGKQKL